MMFIVYQCIYVMQVLYVSRDFLDCTFCAYCVGRRKSTWKKVFSVDVYFRCCSFIFFFFQAEDGIRDKLVTGVQTCALPISSQGRAREPLELAGLGRGGGPGADRRRRAPTTGAGDRGGTAVFPAPDGRARVVRARVLRNHRDRRTGRGAVPTLLPDRYRTPRPPPPPPIFPRPRPPKPGRVGPVR